jgi:ATP-dependent protease ClpP protease subunit
MKKLIVGLCLAAAGCAAQAGQPQKTSVQEVLVRVEAADPAKVSVAPDRIQKSTQLRNPELELSSSSGVLGGKGYIQLASGLSTYDASALWRDLAVLEHMGVQEVDLYVFSGGGSVFAGLALADELERAQRRGFKITAHARGIIASATVPIVAVCQRRIATRGTSFMVHEAKIFKFLDSETAKDLRSQQEMMELTRQRYLETLARRSKRSLAEWAAMEDRTTWFSAEQALAWGLVDELE